MNLSFPLATISIALGMLWLAAIAAPYTLDGYIRLLMRHQFEAERRRDRKRSGFWHFLFRS